MKTQILQLERHDDAVSVSDRMTWAKTPRIILVWPGRGRILARRLDLVLLQRHSQRLGAGLGLVTKDQAVQLNARELGIPCFPSVQAAQANPWRRARRRKLRLRRIEGARPDFRVERPALPGFWAKEMGLPAARLLAFAAGLLAVMALAVALLPSATIHIHPPTETQTVRFNVTVSPEVRAASLAGQAPADVRTVVVEARDTWPASGRTRVADQTAQGSVRFTNLTNEAVTLPPGTIVLASQGGGVRFRTLREGRIRAEAGAFTDIPVQAIAAGSPGNLPAGAIDAVEGTFGLLVTAANPRPTSGGSDRTSPAPTQADLRRLRERLSAALELTALEDLNLTLQPGDRLFPVTLTPTTTLAEIIEPAIGQPSDQVTLTLRTEYSAWVMRGEDLRTIAAGALDANLPSGYSVAPESMTLRDASLPEPAGESRMIWAVISERQILAPLAVERLIQQIAGKPRVQALQLIEQLADFEQPPVIQSWPDWFPWLPFFPHQIQVQMQGAG